MTTPANGITFTHQKQTKTKQKKHKQRNITTMFRRASYASPSSSCSWFFSVVCLVCVLQQQQQQQGENSFLFVSAKPYEDDGTCPILTLLPFSVVPDLPRGPPGVPQSEEQKSQFQRLEEFSLKGASRVSYSLMAAIQLAMDHFNTRNPVVVPELSEEEGNGMEHCSVTFPAQLVRDTVDRYVGLKSILEDSAFYENLRSASKSITITSMNGITITSMNETAPTVPTTKHDLPCALMGAENSEKGSTNMAIATTIQVPHMLYYPGLGALGIFAQPSSVGMHMSTKTQAKRLLSYLGGDGGGTALNQIDHLLCMYGGKHDAMDFASIILNESPSFGLETQIMEMKPRGGSGGGGGAAVVVSPPFETAKSTGIHTILLVFQSPYEIFDIANELDENGMLNGDYFYIIALPWYTPQDLLQDIINAEPQKVGSPVDKLLTGAMMMDQMEYYEMDESSDKLLQAWKEQDSTFVQRLNEMIPLVSSPAGGGGGGASRVSPNTNNNETETKDSPSVFQASDDYFQTTVPSRGSSFAYDSIIALGIGACRMEQKDLNEGGGGDDINMGDGGGGSPPQGGGGGGGGGGSPQPEGGGGGGGGKNSGGGPPPEGGGGGGGGGPPPSNKKLLPYVSAIMDSSFHGASGLVRFGGNSKDNLRDQDSIAVGVFNIRPGDTNPATGTRSYSQVLTSVWKPESLQWEGVDNESFLYSDGTAIPPENFVVTEKNFLYPWVRTVGLTMASFSLVLSAVGAIMTYILKEDEIVKRAQPQFQGLLCVGSIIMTISIFTLSYDEGTGWSEDQLDAACAATPWFFILGQVLAFSALFTKLWMLDRVLQFRRQRVTLQDHVWLPASIFLFSVVVLTIWTIIDPWNWHRELVSVIPPESYGQCYSDKFWAFAGPLVTVLVAAQALTIFFAVKTNDVPKDFRDCNPILLAIGTQLQAWVIGLLILAVLGDSSVNATYFGRVFLIWTFAVSSVAIVVWPRIIFALRLRRNPELRQKGGGRVRISGIITGSNLPKQSLDTITASGEGFDSRASWRPMEQAVSSTSANSPRRRSRAISSSHDEKSVEISKASFNEQQHQAEKTSIAECTTTTGSPAVSDRSKEDVSDRSKEDSSFSDLEIPRSPLTSRREHVTSISSIDSAGQVVTIEQ